MQHAKLRFKESMIWEKEVSEFVESRMKGYTLNAPCGESMLGDVRADILSKPNVTHVCDFFQIPYPDETFDTVISDPIWKIGYYFRPRWFFKAVDLCKVGGRIIYNATWMPISQYTEMEEKPWVRQSATFSDVSVLTIFKKIGKSPPFDYSVKKTEDRQVKSEQK